MKDFLDFHIFLLNFYHKLQTLWLHENLSYTENLSNIIFLLNSLIATILSSRKLLWISIYMKDLAFSNKRISKSFQNISLTGSDRFFVSSSKQCYQFQEIYAVLLLWSFLQIFFNHWFFLKLFPERRFSFSTQRYKRHVYI